MIESRRPLTSRDTNWAKNISSFLAKKNVSPNLISVFSIFFAAITLVSFYLDSSKSFNHVLLMITAIVGIQGRLLMNLLDGMVAIEHNKKSAVGGLYNEVPDRISDSMILFGLYFMVQDYTYGIDLVYASIALSILTAYLRAIGASLHVGHFFSGPMAKPHRMALVSFCCIVAIWYIPVFYYMLLIMNIGLIITCIRRVNKIAHQLKQNV